ncbi:MAG TPA: DNA mismatch repair protein MutS [Dehalococcoidia bacterium]|nr:DNA mismatch repair protein MutS [Dehalococcoidia bacterium]
MTTPLRRQYLEIKRRYPHAILFFRLGDFYETFDQDAETVARELEITLTSRPVGKDQRVPLAGIPHHALDSYLAKLVAKGYKVAICEQMDPSTGLRAGEPGKGKALVDRRVVRVVTPGTLVEENLLERGANNYLAALVGGDGSCGLAHVDISTGEFACTQVDAEAAAAELERLRPAELLLPQGTAAPPGMTATLTPLPGAAFDPDAASERLLAHFGSASLEGLGLAGLTLAATAAGAVLAYLQENQPAALSHVARLTYYRPGGFMLLDGNTRRNLELFDSLRPDPDGRRPLTVLSVLDQTKTAMGARLLRRWLGQPLLDITAIRQRQDGVQLFFDSAVRRGRTTSILAKVPDLERLLARVATAATASPGPATPRDLVALRRGLEAVPGLREAVDHDPGSIEGKRAAHEEQLAGLHPCAEAAGLIAAAVAEDPQQEAVIRPGFSEELDALRSAARDARQFLADLERRERERTGIKSLKVGYNKVFGYYIEVSKSNQRHAPPDYQRRQTLVGGERFTTPELLEHEYRVLHARERQEELEQQLLRQVCAQVAAQGPRILDTAGAVALVDVYCALAEAAVRYGYVRPALDEGDAVVIRDGRHPVVERMLPEGSFVPNDAELSSAEAQVIVLTGPNMAGKSTYLRQVALIALLAQVGSFVPAAEARMGIVDRIFSRVGALDDIAAGRSTFMVEMLETAAILHGATPRSLLLFDEIGRGTSTYDGMAIARAVVEFIHNQPQVAAKTLFATHYHELTDLASVLPRVRNYTVAVAEEEGRVVFLHRILPGGADRSYGVHVAQLAGLPRPVVLRAHELLGELEAGRERGASASRRRQAEAPQLALFAPDGALARELAALDVDSLTPLEAITKLYELAERAREG